MTQQDNVDNFAVIHIMHSKLGIMWIKLWITSLLWGLFFPLGGIVEGMDKFLHINMNL